MTKQTNQENQHTDRELTEETSLPSSAANSDKVESLSNNEEMATQEKELQEEAEWEFDEEIESDEEAMAAVKELDLLDKDVSEPDETGETNFDERDEATVSAEATTEQEERAEHPVLNLAKVEEIEESPLDEEGTQESEEDTRKKRRQKRLEKKPRLRLIPIWFRILLSIVLVGGSLILGMMFGYGIIGGGEPGDAIKPETWYHIVDIIRGN